MENRIFVRFSPPLLDGILWMIVETHIHSCKFSKVNLSRFSLVRVLDYAKITTRIHNGPIVKSSNTTV